MKLDKIQPVDITAIIGAGPPRNRIAQVGVELEGGWNKLPAEVRLTHDGSVRGISSFPPAKEAELIELTRLLNNSGGTNEQQLRFQKLYHEQQRCAEKLKIGELPSPILSMKQADPMYWPVWVRKFYPSHVNYTCGLHVHMSFNRELTYQRLMDSTYSKTILEEMRKWAEARTIPAEHPLWARLAGSCEYCQHLFYAEQQTKERVKRNTNADHRREGSRYTVVNYPWSLLHTVEVRLLPMFDQADLAIEAIQQVINITNAFLMATRRREEWHSVNLVIEPDEAQTIFEEIL